MIPRTLRGAPALLAAAFAVSCQDGVEPLPPVARIALVPADTVLAPGDSVRFVATALDPSGQPIEDVALSFRIGGGAGEIGSDGVFRATEEGVASVVVEGPRSVSAAARVRTIPVTGFSPGHSPFGGLVTLRGAGFGPATEVYFGGAEGLVKEVAPDGRSLTAWVPWDAEVGPVTARLDGVRAVEAPGTFYLTGRGDDALEPNDLAVAAPVSFPFRNPFLMARGDDIDHYAFEVPEATPLTVRLVDRGPAPAWDRRVVLQLNEGDDVEEFLGIAPAYSFGDDAPLDGVVSRSRVEPGRYTARVFLAGLAVIDRRYELRIDTVASFVLAPDRWEANDHPAEAPRVSLPFADTLAMENPWSVDYFTFDVLQRSVVEVDVETFGGALAVFLLDGERSVHWHLANGTKAVTWRGSIAPFQVHGVRCRVEPGTYHMAVIENSGTAAQYALTASAEPSSEGFLNCLGEPSAETAPRALGAPAVR